MDTMLMFNNAMNATVRLATLEVVAMGRKMGLSLAALTQAINQSTGRSWISQVALQGLVEGKHLGDSPLSTLVKDVDAVIALAAKVGAPLPLASLTRSMLQIGVNTLGPESSVEDLTALIGSMAGAEIADSAQRQRVAIEPGSDAPAAIPPIIGYVGLGAMGAAMARRLLARSCQVMVYDVREDSVRELVADGAQAAPDLPSLARECDVIMICVPTSAVVREVVFGAGGLAEGLAPGTVIIDQTTGDPAATRAIAGELEARGIAMVDAPVSGGPAGAAQGTMVTFCGGSPEAFAQVQPLLALTGPTVVHFGPSGSGNVAKLIKNTLGACNRLISYEMVALGVKAGLKLDDMARVVNKNSGWTLAFERVMPVLATGGRTANLRIELMVKDLNLACRQGAECGAPMLVANAVRCTVEAGANELGHDANLDELARLYEARAGIRFADGAGAA